MFSFLSTNFPRDKHGVPDPGMPVTCLDLSAEYSKQIIFILHDIIPSSQWRTGGGGGGVKPPQNLQPPTTRFNTKTLIENLKIYNFFESNTTKI